MYMKKTLCRHIFPSIPAIAHRASIFRRTNVARKFSLAASLFVVILTAPSHAAKKDPRATPRFDLYPGAAVINTKIIEYNSLTIYTKLDQAQPETRHVKGDTRQISYRVAKVSPEKVFQNYDQAVRDAGFKILYQCAAELCGSHATRVAAARALFMEVPPQDKQVHYLVAQKEEAGLPLTFAVMVTTNNVATDAHIVTTYLEQTPVELGLVRTAKDYRPMSETRVKPAVQPDKDDHPLLPRYPGSKDIALTKTDYGSLNLPEASLEATPETAPLRGQLHQAIYMARDVSAEKIFLNYKQALEQAGFTVSALCEPDGCPVRKTQLTDIAARLYPKQSPRGFHGYYLKAARGTVQLGLLITDAEQKGTAYVRQAIIEIEDLETGLIEITSDEIAQQVRHTGKALIYGIYFDTGKSTIKAESKSALDAINGFLKSHPDMDFYVVGHTDDTGQLESNLGLSRNRAAAVVKELVDSYGIPAKRLSPQGVGPFAPAAGNQTDGGRTQNRRVELVWRLAN